MVSPLLCGIKIQNAYLYMHAIVWCSRVSHPSLEEEGEDGRERTSNAKGDAESSGSVGSLTGGGTGGGSGSAGGGGLDGAGGRGGGNWKGPWSVYCLHVHGSRNGMFLPPDLETAKV